MRVHAWLALLFQPRAIAITLLFGIFILLLIALQPPSAPNSCLVGDVRALHAGRVPDALRHAQLDAQRMQVGLGAAAIEGWEGLGDGVAISGRVFVRSTRSGSVRVQSLESGRFFQSSYWVYVARATPAHETLSVQAATSLENLWRQLARSHPQGVMVAGYTHWRALRRYAITRPAINGVAILENATHYYTQPMHNMPDTWAYVVGIAASPQAIARADENYAPLLARQADGGLDLPIHVLALKAAPTDLTRAPLPQEVLTVGRAAGDSQLISAELAFYPLHRPGPCADAFVSSNPSLSGPAH